MVAYRVLERKHFDIFIKRLRLAYPTFAEWEANCDPEKLAGHYNYWFDETQLRGVSAIQLFDLYREIISGQVFETGRFRPEFVFEYINRKCRSHELYLDWRSNGCRGRCPTLIDDPEKREEAIRLSKRPEPQYIEPPRPLKVVRPEDTREYWEQQCDEAGMKPPDPKLQAEIAEAFRKNAEWAARRIGYDPERDGQ